MSDDLGVDEEFNPSNEQIADALLDFICPAGEPWTGDDPTADHGHTQCMWIGLAIQRLRPPEQREITLWLCPDCDLAMSRLRQEPVDEHWTEWQCWDCGHVFGCFGDGGQLDIGII